MNILGIVLTILLTMTQPATDSAKKKIYDKAVSDRLSVEVFLGKKRPPLNLAWGDTPVEKPLSVRTVRVVVVDEAGPLTVGTWLSPQARGLSRDSLWVLDAAVSGTACTLVLAKSGGIVITSFDCAGSGGMTQSRLIPTDWTLIADLNATMKGKVDAKLDFGNPTRPTLRIVDHRSRPEKASMFVLEAGQWRVEPAGG